MSVIIQKYGGTSVGNIERILNVAQNISKMYKNGYRLVVVVSAMSGETTRLLDLAQNITNDNKNRELDTIAATGEQITIALLSLALQKINIPAKSYCGWQIPIITTNDYTQARIKTIPIEKIKQDLNDNIVVVVAGFQGVTQNGEITTLGRGGSDTSAVALAIALNAQECQIYTDVNGVYNADPNKITIAKRIEVINGTCMLESASLGAKVLHVRSCELAYRYKTNIRVLSTFAPKDQGSLIMNQSELENYPIISVSTQDAQTIIKFKSLNINISPIMVQIYNICTIDMVQISQDDISFVVDEIDAEQIELALKKLNIKNITIIHNLTKISAIGSGFRSNNTLNQKIWRLLNEVEIFATSHNEISISILIHNFDATSARNKLANLLTS